MPSLTPSAGRLPPPRMVSVLVPAPDGCSESGNDLVGVGRARHPGGMAVDTGFSCPAAPTGMWWRCRTSATRTPGSERTTPASSGERDVLELERDIDRHDGHLAIAKRDSPQVSRPGHRREVPVREKEDEVRGASMHFGPAAGHDLRGCGPDLAHHVHDRELLLPPVG